MSLTLTGNVMSFKSRPFAKYLSDFVIFPGLLSAGCKNLTKYHFKHSLSSIFRILIETFIGWCNSLGNFV